MKSPAYSGKPKKFRLLLVRRVVGKSMWPMLRPGQIVFVVPRFHYRNEDVVVLQHNGIEKIKRVRAVQGDHYDVRGDNPSKSTDSRQFGVLEKSAILGKVIWPRV